jgi:catechol 2,3-dioxygenase-like lactoylglutathione lyase family enzyme
VRFLGVHHVALVTKNMEESLRFYRDLLGCTLLERFFDEGERADIAFLSLGNTLLELLAPENPEGLVNPSGFHLALWVDDVTSVFEFLKTQGVPVLLPPTESHGFHYAYFSGPMGEVVEIVKRQAQGYL